MSCSRCGRSHSGVCGIPRSPARSRSGYVPSDVLFPVNLMHGQRPDQRLAEGQRMIEARLNKLKRALQDVVAEIEREADEPLSREEKLLRQMIRRLVEHRQ